MVKPKVSIEDKAKTDLSGQLWHPLFAGGIPRHLTAGAVLFAAGDAGDGGYRVEEGLLKVQVTSPWGEVRIVSLLGPGAILGELSLIDGMPRSATVIALRDSVLTFVSQEAFERHTRTRPEAFQALAAILSMRLRNADAVIAASSFLSVRARVARALLDLAKHTGTAAADGSVVLDFMVSQADLAAMAGIARENVSRVFSDFRKNKVLTVLPRGIRLDDIAAIERELKIG
jgi:CRP/FNR family transcriptional regulator, cyclic AMP receptor protein